MLVCYIRNFYEIVLFENASSSFDPILASFESPSNAIGTLIWTMIFTRISYVIFFVFNIVKFAAAEKNQFTSWFDLEEPKCE